MKSWPSKLIAATAALGLCAGFAYAQTSNTVAMNYQSVPALLKQAKMVGHHATDSIIKLTFSLKLNNTNGLKTFLENVQNPQSPVYHHWLTPEQAKAQFGPTAAQVAAVEQGLNSRGIKVLNVTPNNILIHTQATSGTYEHALGIMINDYTLGKRTFFSTPDRPKLPASIAGFVQNVIGLNNAAVMHPMHSLGSPIAAKAGGKHPVANVPAPPPATSAYYDPYQIATAYQWPDITNAGNAAGVTVAILTADSSGLSTNTDYTNFWAAFNLPDHTTNVIPVDGDEGATDGMVETLLDMEWDGAMGPGVAQNVYVAANPNFSTFTDMYSQFQTDNSAQVMTTSWGSAEVNWGSLESTIESIFELAAAQGISMFAAAGDYGSGDNTGTDNACEYPAASVYITAAGGTDLYATASGQYISENAWASTGGAVCELPQPTWNTGPGVPANGVRDTSDMAMDAGSLRPYDLLWNGEWYNVYGTSAVAPQLASLFADAVTLHGGVSLGLSPELIYNDVNAGDYASDFRDITTGDNGYPAGPNWDHPTGWGTPLATSLISHLGIQGPKGTVAGTVTDASTGNPIQGANIVFTPGNWPLTTNTNGQYSEVLPAGDYTATVTAFGYQSQAASLTVSDGQTTVQDFALEPAPTARLHGLVIDRGHHYPLFAEVLVKDGNVTAADVWTNPRTGAYSASVPTGATYTITVTPNLPGYAPGNATVTVNGDTQKYFPMVPDSSCSAPGYAYQFGEDFNEGEFPPAGWTVTNNVFGSNVVWMSTSQNTYNTGNFTGGTGNAADADSNAAGTAVGSYDTSLVTPPISTTLVGQSPVLYFRENFQVYSGNEAFDVDISTDGGNTWTTVDHQTNACGGLYTLPGCPEELDLGSYVSGAENFQLRFRYYNLLSDFDWYVQVDDVSIGICAPVPGGLVNGGAYDYNTGTPLTGATVTDESGNSVTTKVVDGHLGFTMFEPTGDHTLTADKHNYQANVKTVLVHGGKSESIRFAMRAGKLTSQPSQAVLNVPVNTQQNYSLRIVNSGSALVEWMLSSLNAPAPDVHKLGKTNLSLRLVQGHFSPASLIAPAKEGRAASAARPTGPALAPAQGSSAWEAVADYPILVLDSCAATDETTGRVYTVGGVSDGVMVASGYVYDPATGSWSSIANLPQPLQKPVCTMIAGKLYVTGGWESNYIDNNQALYIYDPTTDSWSEGPNDLVSIGGASSGVALNGEFFVIGGCTTGSCSPLSAAVQAYDPTTNSWSMAADYPQGVAWQGCGATKGKIYCAGGVTGASTDTNNAYAYDPSTDSWSAIAPMPYDNWAMSAVATSDGHLLLQDGVTGGFGAVTNQGAIYDVVTGDWADLPNNIATVYRAAGACGFYMIGGMTNGLFVGVSNVELLPSFDVCNAQPVPWVSFAPASGTLGIRRKGMSVVTIDGSGQTAGTSSHVQIILSGNTPYDDVVIPLTVNWTSGG